MEVTTVILVMVIIMVMVGIIRVTDIIMVTVGIIRVTDIIMVTVGIIRVTDIIMVTVGIIRVTDIIMVTVGIIRVTDIIMVMTASNVNYRGIKEIEIKIFKSANNAGFLYGIGIIIIRCLLHLTGLSHYKDPQFLLVDLFI
ncbi:hypothetical protein [Saccharococcus thermophilus]|uniref:Uncharacterized protein n=1 Tax=Saccharococcus thermophilus TaxID=29396 RepID=A0A846MGH1_9BACL|nr:hypothetical protein [Saccharococcus thermophilus]NIK15279.1 hypothetical protein [Saccharococcus thermophilus]